MVWTPSLTLHQRSVAGEMSERPIFGKWWNWIFSALMTRRLLLCGPASPTLTVLSRLRPQCCWRLRKIQEQSHTMKQEDYICYKSQVNRLEYIVRGSFCVSPQPVLSRHKTRCTSLQTLLLTIFLFDFSRSHLPFSNQIPLFADWTGL